jgi:hypothetical protein
MADADDDLPEPGGYTRIMVHPCAVHIAGQDPDDRDRLVEKAARAFKQAFEEECPEEIERLGVHWLDRAIKAFKSALHHRIDEITSSSTGAIGHA